MADTSSLKRLRIAFVVDRFGNRYGGAEAYGVELMRELAKRHEITVFARDYDAACDLRLPFVPLRSPKGLPSWLRVLIFAFRARMKTRGRYDIVHSHMNGFCGDVEVVHVTPVRYNWRVKELPPLKRFMSRLSVRVHTYLALESMRVRSRKGHRVVGVSGLIREQLEVAYGPAQNLPVVPPGVCKLSANDDTTRAQTRARLGYTDDDIVCLLVARNPLRKGLPTVLRALAVLPQNYKLLVVGANDAAREFLYSTPEFAAISDRVTMLPPSSEVAPYYVAGDIYVHPSLNDSFGMAPLEAMSYGLPVILSPTPWCGFAQYVEAGREAIVLSHPEAHDEVAEGIKSITGEPAIAASLKSGGARVVERHSWAEAARQFEAIYEQCLAEKRAEMLSRGAPDDSPEPGMQP